MEKLDGTRYAKWNEISEDHATQVLPNNLNSKNFTTEKTISSQNASSFSNESEPYNNGEIFQEMHNASPPKSPVTFTNHNASSIPNESEVHSNGGQERCIRIASPSDNSGTLTNCNGIDASSIPNESEPCDNREIFKERCNASPSKRDATFAILKDNLTPESVSIDSKNAAVMFMSCVQSLDEQTCPSPSPLHYFNSSEDFEDDLYGLSYKLLPTQTALENIRKALAEISEKNCNANEERRTFSKSLLHQLEMINLADVISVDGPEILFADQDDSRLQISDSYNGTENIDDNRPILDSRKNSLRDVYKDSGNSETSSRCDVISEPSVDVKGVTSFEPSISQVRKWSVEAGLQSTRPHYNDVFLEQETNRGMQMAGKIKLTDKTTSLHTKLSSSERKKDETTTGNTFSGLQKKISHTEHKIDPRIKPRIRSISLNGDFPQVITDSGTKWNFRRIKGDLIQSRKYCSTEHIVHDELRKHETNSVRKCFVKNDKQSSQEETRKDKVSTTCVVNHTNPSVTAQCSERQNRSDRSSVDFPRKCSNKKDNLQKLQTGSKETSQPSVNDANEAKNSLVLPKTAIVGNNPAREGTCFTQNNADEQSTREPGFSEQRQFTSCAQEIIERKPRKDPRHDRKHDNRRCESFAEKISHSLSSSSFLKHLASHKQRKSYSCSNLTEANNNLVKYQHSSSNNSLVKYQHSSSNNNLVKYQHSSSNNNLVKYQHSSSNAATTPILHHKNKYETPVSRIRFGRDTLKRKMRYHGDASRAAFLEDYQRSLDLFAPERLLWMMILIREHFFFGEDTVYKGDYCNQVGDSLDPDEIWCKAKELAQQAMFQEGVLQSMFI